jgi:Ca2+/Na+ antiporter
LINNINLYDFRIEIYFLIFLTLLLVVLGFIGKKFFFSKREGLVLVIVYILFILYQVLPNFPFQLGI